MRLPLVLVLALAPSCSIPSARFHPPEDGNNNGDAAVDTGVDAPPPPPALRHGYITDFAQGGGVFLINKDATGALTLASTTPVPAGTPQGAIANKQGTHLFVLDISAAAGSTIRDFLINTDGTLTAKQNVPTGACTPSRFGALHPSGNFVALGCSNADVVLMRIRSDGSADPNLFTMPAGQNPIVPAFSPDGNCAYFADLNGPATSRILIYQVDAVAGQLNSKGSATGPAVPRGLAAHPTAPLLYMAGGGTPPVVQAYSIRSDCSLSPGVTGAIGPNTGTAVVDPTGTHLLVTGTEVYSFLIDATGAMTPVPGSPFLATGTTMDGAIFDPALPNSLYITGRGYQGTFQAKVAADGTITMGSSVNTNHGGSYWFAMAP